MTVNEFILSISNSGAMQIKENPDIVKIAIVIPAFNPDNRLINLITDLLKLRPFSIIIVDDGSSPECQPLFDKLNAEHGCVILKHDKNCGKGAALKTGFHETARLFPLYIGFVTADADGQHSPEDIVRVAEILEAQPRSLVLGTRCLSGKGVPYKVRWLNCSTTFLFHFITGVYCRDMQNGLRGIPACFAWYCCSIPGSHFEFEINNLFEASMRRIPFLEVPIQTVFHKDNSSFYFRPFRDSMSIYINIIKYGLSALVSVITDIVLFTLLIKLIFSISAGDIFVATVSARVISCWLGFMFNRFWGFAKKEKINENLKKYPLFCVQMLASALMVTFLSHIDIPIVLIKIFVDIGLFFLIHHHLGAQWKSSGSTV